MSRENICENRRGYASYFALSSSINQLFVYSSRVIAHSGTTLSYDNSGAAGTYAGSVSTTLKEVNGPVPPGTYTVRVAATNACGTSEASAPRTIVVP